MAEWMENVEKAIARIMADKVYTSAEFKRERDNFHALCKDLERTEVKKWLAYNSKPVTLRNNRGRDTFEYTTKYCYEYQDLKFDGKTPEEFLRGAGTEVLSGEPPSRLRTRIFIGVVTPKMMPSGFTTFDLCLD